MLETYNTNKKKKMIILRKYSKIIVTVMLLILMINSVTYVYAETPVKEKYDFDEDTTEWLVEEPDTPPVGSTQYLITDWYGGWWVDAEKIPGSDGGGNTPPDNVGDEDDLACWAATASNMIDYAGWGFVGGMDNADEYLDHFEDHWTDYGSLTEYGLEWWFDGTVTYPGDDWADEDVA